MSERAVLDELDRLSATDQSLDEIGRDQIVESVGRAALLGARGNSGVILSQLIRGAVEELIRWVTPLNNFFRTATRDAQIADTAVRAGDRVILLYPSANRDSAAFADPFKFDITRTPNKHLGFGGHGPHHCLGQNLARMEIIAIFDELTKRMPDLAPNGPVDRLPGQAVFGFHCLGCLGF